MSARPFRFSLLALLAVRLLVAVLVCPSPALPFVLPLLAFPRGSNLIA